MEEFLGILFCGGKGTRLGLITHYISKAFVPVYDRPVFMYPLGQLQASKYISEIIILTNKENDAKLRELGYQTIIQDDNVVHDMFSGLYFIKKLIDTEKHFVMMPCDNVSDVVVDQTIEIFLKSQSQAELCFNVIHIKDKRKLREMGVYNSDANRIRYKPKDPASQWGIIAPYVARNCFKIPDKSTDEMVFNQANCTNTVHQGYWFDVGDIEDLTKSSAYIANQMSHHEEPDSGRDNSDD